MSRYGALANIQSIMTRRVRISTRCLDRCRPMGIQYQASALVCEEVRLLSTRNNKSIDGRNLSPRKQEGRLFPGRPLPDLGDESDDMEEKMQLAALEVLLSSLGDDPVMSKLINNLILDDESNGNDMDDDEDFHKFLERVKSNFPDDKDVIDKLYNTMKDMGYLDYRTINTVLKEAKDSGDPDSFIAKLFDAEDDDDDDILVEKLNVDKLVNDAVADNFVQNFNQNEMKNAFQNVWDDDISGRHYWNESHYDDDSGLDDSEEYASTDNAQVALIDKEEKDNDKGWDKRVVDLENLPSTYKTPVEKYAYEDAIEKEFFGPNSDVMAYLENDDDDDGNSSDEEDPDDYARVTPLKQGPSDSFLGFLRDMEKHPTMYARIDYHDLHLESRREPVPDFPSDRINPSIEFIQSFSRFVYVTGLPPLEIDGESGDINNPMHRSIIENIIASLVKTETWKVYAVSLTSGFVGLASEEERFKLLSFHARPTVSTGASISEYNGQKNEQGIEFFNVSPETTLYLEGIPPGNTASSLVTKLNFLDDGNLSPESFFFLSGTSCLVRLASKQRFESALNSSDVRYHLQEFGKCTVSFFRARRELVHDGFLDAGKVEEKRKLGPRLIVDGDMPSKDFYLSHAGVLKVKNLDPDLTKEQIAQAFYPYSTLDRDINGSIELIYSTNGIPTGEAYVGFDVAGDCEDIVYEFKVKSLEELAVDGKDSYFVANSKLKLNGPIGVMKLGNRFAVLKTVKDRKIPNWKSTQPERRPDRPIDELVRDLYDWEQHVDPADLVELENAGVSKVILDETFRVIRFKNETFGPLDSSLRSEALNPEQGFGEEYRSLVQLYIRTLKECIATPDNVGSMYEMLHFPDEEIDLTVFDSEKERQKRLHKQKGR